MYIYIYVYLYVNKALPFSTLLPGLCPFPPSSSFHPVSGLWPCSVPASSIPSLYLHLTPGLNFC